MITEIKRIVPTIELFSIEFTGKNGKQIREIVKDLDRDFEVELGGSWLQLYLVDQGVYIPTFDRLTKGARIAWQEDGALISGIPKAYFESHYVELTPLVIERMEKAKALNG